ncbi:ABC transporter substrate-binding protein [Fluviispira sanaruensis]|uniref:ABC transporter substrate-binding protein n=2 Tax=Fluviispira sanaruensis TaxID=2493639 RepID=A0A4P2VGM8_FLUSA|nr:ABC transporter substrate-binding protein [Fluviispira sanaruensis]
MSFIVFTQGGSSDMKIRSAKIAFFIFLFLFSIQLFLKQNLFAKWDGPTDGPSGQSAKNIIFISADFRNGGVSSVYRGFEAAAEALSWNVKIVNADGGKSNTKKLFIDALKLRPHAIVLGGFPPEELGDEIEQAKKLKIILIGWHVTDKPGPYKDVFTNITTDPKEVAKIAAEYAIKDGKKKAGVVFLNDDRFPIANTKTEAMRKIIESCEKCKVLSVENIPLTNASEDILSVVPRLNEKFGKSWTHTLAINDSYFDKINYALANSGRKDIRNVSAGDGSLKALTRIRSGYAYQLATVAEPLNSQGWQLADELNRAFAGKPPSGFINKPVLVTKNLLERLKKSYVDSGSGYEDAYIKIWGQNKKKNK